MLKFVVQCLVRGSTSANIAFKMTVNNEFSERSGEQNMFPTSTAFNQLRFGYWDLYLIFNIFCAFQRHPLVFGNDSARVYCALLTSHHLKGPFS